MKKKAQLNARQLRFTRALLKQHRVAVVRLDPQGIHGLIDWKYIHPIKAGRLVADGITTLPHHWTFYFAAFCRNGNESYIKAEEVEPEGQYKSDQLIGVIEKYHDKLLETCNPNHVVGTGWIALPYSFVMDPAQAAAIFEAVGAWEKVAA